MFAFILIRHSLMLKENDDRMKILLEKMQYEKNNWIYEDMKVIWLHLGLKSGYTKYPCLFCVPLGQSSKKRAQWL